MGGGRDGGGVMGAVEMFGNGADAESLYGEVMVAAAGVEAKVLDEKEVIST